MAELKENPEYVYIKNNLILFLTNFTSVIVVLLDRVRQIELKIMNLLGIMQFFNLR